MKKFPPPKQENHVDYPWFQLTLGVNSTNFNILNPIIKDFWALIIEELNKTGNTIDVFKPEDEAWFHIRWTNRKNDEPKLQKYAFGRIEIFRLKKGFLSKNEMEKIRILPRRYKEVTCAGWLPYKFLDHHDNAFLSFIQKLSILRVRDNISNPEFLAQITNVYDKCPYCQKAYQTMISDNQPWSKHLKPWFVYMEKTKMEKIRTHEYAHWFGHILSSFPNTIL